MRAFFWTYFLLIVTCFGAITVYGQEDNFNGINIQGQLKNHESDFLDFELMLFSFSNDTVWHESHELIELSEEGEFRLTLGQGIFINGEVLLFNEIDWTFIDKIELYSNYEDRQLIGQYRFKAVPFALHSKKVATSPLLVELSDISPDIPLESEVFKFDGLTFGFESDLIIDTAIYVLNSGYTEFSDTANFAYNNDFADTAFFAFYSDTSFYALELANTHTSDSSSFTDSANVVHTSIGNWNINGSEGLADTNFVGPSNEAALRLATNNNQRLLFEDDFEMNNGTPGIGFRINSINGHLFSFSDTPTISLLSDPFIFAEGANHSFHGGASLGAFDTLKGAYSFAWGENVGTNGSYSTVFGQNTYGDSAFYAGTNSLSSFALGRNCRVTHMGVAIGDSAIANHYRNVAIGKNVIATTNNANTAIGSNVFISGAVAIGIGHNLFSSGNFSVVFGSNASSISGHGSFLYGDFSTSDTVFSTNSNQFMARSAGGVIFYSSPDLSMGVELLAGAGSWTMISDINKKRNLELLNPLQFQHNFRNLSIASWNYIGFETVHFGPMAQDIYSNFNVGEKPYLINMIDGDGITFLGIKMVNDMVNTFPSQEQVKLLENRILSESESLDSIEFRINHLYEVLDNN